MAFRDIIKKTLKGLTMQRNELFAQNLYLLFEVEPSASLDDIKKQFRKLARTCHPDLHPNDPSAEAAFVKLNCAMDIFLNPSERTLYDLQYRTRFGESSASTNPSAQDATASHHADPVTKNSEKNKSEQSTEPKLPIKEKWVKLLKRSKKVVFDLLDIEDDSYEGEVLVLDFKQAVQGVKKKVALERVLRCPKEQPAGIHPKDCACAGFGTLIERRYINLNIPAGVEDGQRIRLKVNKKTKSESRYRYFMVRIKPDPLLSQKGDNLMYQVAVKASDLIEGTKVKIPVMNGFIKVTIPPGTVSGTTLRVADKGMPIKGRKGFGDMLVLVESA